MDETPQVGHHSRAPAHYYGDVVRALFLAAAIVMFIGAFTATGLPLPTIASICWIVVLVLIAGLTNPIQRGVQWVNVIISVIGVLIFGGDAFSRFHTFTDLFGKGIFIAAVGLIFILSLYFATRTLRAHILLYRAPPHHHS